MSLIRLSDQNELVETSKFKYGKYSFEHFNCVQSRVFEIYDKECNCIIAAPTGVGKTICAEFFMIDEIKRRGGKSIYLAPLRALAKEKIDEWTSENSIFNGFKIAICTGDYRLTESRKKELEEADLIVMTSEMLSSRCRNMDSEKNEFLKKCGTVVVDEGHLLTVSGRGDHLEVGLMKFSQIAKDLRIVCLSATMPNVDEIANWVACSLVKKDTYLITSNYRPCPLEIHYKEYDSYGTYDIIEDNKIDKVIDIVKQYKNDKFLVFVHSKNTGERILKALEEIKIESFFHNANLDKDKRQKIENDFKFGNLRVLVATSTLAWGVNTPARRVIIAGVHRGMTEVENYDTTQMVGRAGRPGFDDRGDAYILIPDKKADYYIEKLSNPQKIESQLLSSTGGENPHYKTLAFHLVSEIHHGNISTKDDVHNWYGRSLAYFQYKELDENIANKTLDLLEKVGAVKYLNEKYEVTSVGKVSSMMYYSPFDVADLRRNFKLVFSNNLENNDLAVAFALGNVDSIRGGFVTRAEKDEMEGFSFKLKKAFGDQIDSAVKGAYIYHCLINGLNLGAFTPIGRTLQMDFDRVSSVLKLLDTLAAKWNKDRFFKELSMRISYGVRAELIDLCKMPNIGKVRAEKLYAVGFRKASDLNNNFDLAKKILNMKEEKIREMMENIN